MAANDKALEIKLPALPAKHEDFIQYFAANKDEPLRNLLAPYNQYDAEMRKVFAQHPGHPGTNVPNVVPVFAGGESNVLIHARSIETESNQEKGRYILPLREGDRRVAGSPAIVQSLQEFRTNFSVFSEQSLADLDWSNVVVAGSAVVTSLLAVPENHAGSKRALRQYYHETLAPASDVDLFLYGLTEEQAIEKIRHIETKIRDAILAETTTVRTKNAITIASKYPNRHVQVVLRIYKSISEILTGFDVDCSCVAYDGKQVYASPRALVAYMTQINTIDLSRRSPSYENRLSKYAHRGFEVYWPLLDRTRVDPTIFERNFGRVEGLARLLVLEKLPSSSDRDRYLDQRRHERGRPSINRTRLQSRRLPGNFKEAHEDDVAEWVEADEVSNYHTFTIPYGPKYTARKIERLLYTKDLLLNADWNRPRDREVTLHRHPAFFGRLDDVIHDCCGYCPKPSTLEEEEVANEESKIYIAGEMKFIQDDPGRQAIGSFNPLTAEDWTDMAYVGNTALLCQAIVDGDAEYVRTWLAQEGNDPNTRDYTGRTPLHLAVATSTTEVVQYLIDGGARLIARLVDGKTALHIAAMRGSVEIVSTLLRKSESNEEEEAKKLEARRKSRSTSDSTAEEKESVREGSSGNGDGESDIDMVDADEGDDGEAMETTTENSMVKVKLPSAGDDQAIAMDDRDDPDVYDINTIAWDTHVSPLHLAIVNGHCDVVKCLVQDFGADVLLPIKLLREWDSSARGAILTLVLALQLPGEKAEEMSRTLMQLGSTSAQADLNMHTALEYCVATRPDILKDLLEHDNVGARRAMNHVAMSGNRWQPSVSSPLLTAIRAKDSLSALHLLSNGAKPNIDYASWVKACENCVQNDMRHYKDKKLYANNVQQPVIAAIEYELPDVACVLLEEYAEDVNTLSKDGARVLNKDSRWPKLKGMTILDEARAKLNKLRKWKPEEDDAKPPLGLEQDSEYLSKYSEGSYMHWSARKQLASAQKKYEDEMKQHEMYLERVRDRTGVEEKQMAIQDLIGKYERLEAVLLSKGAKTFADIHQTAVEEDDNAQSARRNTRMSKESKPFEVSFTMRCEPSHNETTSRYLALFEASWAGDIKTVKELCLMPWKTTDGDEQPPLKVSARDEHDMCPFSIAVVRGNFELATAVMQIAQAQYVPPEKGHEQRYTLDTADDVAAESDRIPIYGEIIDNQFTIETVGEISTLVKSRTKPVRMILRDCQAAWDFVRKRSSSLNTADGRDLPREQHRRWHSTKKTMNLLVFALHNNDLDLLTFLLSMANEYTRADIDGKDHSSGHYFAIDHEIFRRALEYDHPRLIAEIMKKTGAGVPLEQLVKKAGVEVVERPVYYQGLSVYGRKRQDWADRGMHAGLRSNEPYRPPILHAAKRGAVETVEWLLSEAPIRCYKEFANANQDDKRLQRLSETPGGFEASVRRFLDTRSQLAIHCCVMGKPTRRNNELLRFLVGQMPEAINAKSQQGITPLHLAFLSCRFEAAQILIEAGADQTCRDRLGRNVVHHLLDLASVQHEVIAAQKMFELIDKRLHHSLFTERSAQGSGALTPLAHWVSRSSSLHQCRSSTKKDMVRTILRYSQGAELKLLNGEGHCPLHVSVHNGDFASAQVMIEHDPTLILRENATGRTAYEIAEDSRIAQMTEGPPKLPGSHKDIATRANYIGLPEEWAMNIIDREAMNITDREARSFVQPVKRGRRNRHEKLWNLLQVTNGRLQEQGRAKRRLVSLNEANEVARRLAASHAWQGLATGSGDDDGEQDEVQLWMNRFEIDIEAVYE